MFFGFFWIFFSRGHGDGSGSKGCRCAFGIRLKLELRSYLDSVTVEAKACLTQRPVEQEARMKSYLPDEAVAGFIVEMNQDTWEPFSDSFFSSPWVRDRDNWEMPGQRT